MTVSILKPLDSRTDTRATVRGWWLPITVAIGVLSLISLSRLQRLTVPWRTPAQVTNAESLDAWLQSPTKSSFQDWLRDFPDQSGRLQVSQWDPLAPVYVTVGVDDAPGVSGVDDDGDAVVDSRSELGATGSDDEIVTPDHPLFATVQSGQIVSQRLSTGAMVRVSDVQTIQAPAQLRIDVIDSEQRLHSRVYDLK